MARAEATLAEGDTLVVRASASVARFVRFGRTALPSDPEDEVRFVGPLRCLHELHIESMGVIETLDLVLSPGLTAFTGETGAGKTMLVEAINLLVGGRADPSIVRTGAAEARVEGRFVVGDDEYVVSRVIPMDGGRAPMSTGDWQPRRRWPSSGRALSICTGSTPIRACCPRRRSATRSIGSAQLISNRCERLGRD